MRTRTGLAAVGLLVVLGVGRVEAQGCGNLGAVHFTIASSPPVAGGLVWFWNPQPNGTFVYFTGGSGTLCLPAGHHSIMSGLGPGYNGYEATEPGSPPMYSFGDTDCRVVNQSETTCSPNTFSISVNLAAATIHGTVK